MTLRGSERRAVVLKTPESAVFEEAVFLMRSDGEAEADGEELVCAAGRIVEENLILGEAKRRKRGRASAFFIGFLLGTVPGLLLWLLSRF